MRSHEEKLSELKETFDAGVTLAALAALDYCDRNGLPSPQWVATEAKAVLFARFDGEKSGKRGRSSGMVSRARQDLVDCFRWDTVDMVGEKLRWLKGEIATLSKLTGKKARARLAEVEHLYRAAGTDRFECASRLLVGTAAFGGPDAVKKSYQRVQGAQAMRYYTFDRRFFRKVGIDVDRFCQGKELAELLGL